jgi:acid phosphatase type 7
MTILRMLSLTTGIICPLLVQTGCSQQTAADLPTSQLLSQPGPTFRVAEDQLHPPVTFITYGDQRFTDPANVTATNPRARQFLVQRIAEEKPVAVVLNGDVPLAGIVKNDYEVFKSETKPWRDAHFLVLPALGNHEFSGRDPRECLENWWAAFPELRDRRWYSTQLGQRIYIIALDSDTSLLTGSNQAKWLAAQVEGLPASVDFVVITMHHPPMADIQTHIQVNHNPRPNEIALRDYLSLIAPKSHARFIVSAGHIHNYERLVKDDVVYLVSGGGGAQPYYVERAKDDLYQSDLFPNYHYVKFVLDNDRLRATMYRIRDPEASTLAIEAKDVFEVVAKPRTTAK